MRLDRSASLEDFVGAVCAVAGLGPWTAHYLALRLGEPDACPITDLALRRTLARLTPQTTALDALAEGWRPWRALATTHIWAASADRVILESEENRAA